MICFRVEERKRLTATPAFNRDGLLIIFHDEIIPFSKQRRKTKMVWFDAVVLGVLVFIAMTLYNILFFVRRIADKY
jgi:hypothetical protein